MMMNKDEIKKIILENPNLHEYLNSYTTTLKEKLDKPIVFYKKLPFDLKNEKYPNVIYPTKSSIFIHVYRTWDMDEPEYHVIEPRLNDLERKKYNEISNLILEKAPSKKEAKNDDELREVIKEIIDEVTVVTDEKENKDNIRGKGFLTWFSPKKIRLTSVEKNKIEFTLLRDIIGSGYIECFMRDPYIEDIHVIPGEEVHLVHKVFSMIRTNVKIDPEDAPKFTRDMSERIGSPVSVGKPIVDGTLPDGSRVNIIYSDDVSLKGPTMTIRKFSETPISVIQLTKWGTMSAEIAAYLWLCLEYGLNVFVCGETASGKTTTLNAIIPFIPPNKKIYTAESTPEIHVPHPVWQQLLTKDYGPEEGKVDLFALLKAALRSRPDYVIPGETRGIEGRILFQAMQTGHPCLTTFHAGSIRQVIQRFVGDPINVPKTFMDNLNVVVIQRAIQQKGDSIRRCLSVEEIESYNRELDAIMSRTVFEWSPVEDRFFFRGDRNSYILEEKIAKLAGYKHTADIYDEHRYRTKIVEKLVEGGVEDYYEVTHFIWDFYRRKKGVKKSNTYEEKNKEEKGVY
jgi:flagellar protein FlaI